MTRTEAAMRSPGIDSQNCLHMKIPKALTSAGTMTPLSLFSRPSPDTMRNSGK